MNAFQVFKIILGIVASLFILYILVNYAGSFSNTQTDVQRMMISNNFKKATDDVYFSGNPAVFDDFGRLDFDLMFNGAEDPAKLRSSAGEITLRTPIIFTEGEILNIEKPHPGLDFGWWRFGFVHALPELTLIFSSGDASIGARDLIKSIAGLLPDTTGRSPKIRFGFCDGSDIIMPCSGSFCERAYFYAAVNSQQMPMAKCSVTPLPGQRMIRVSSGCSAGSEVSGACIWPNAGDYFIGKAYINGSLLSYPYMSPLDLLSLIVAGDGENMYGIKSQTLYDYQNREFRQQLALMCKSHIKRTTLLLTTLPISDEKESCMPYYQNFKTSLESICDTGGVIDQDNYYMNLGMVMSLRNYLNEAGAAYERLVGLGCEEMVK